MLSLLGYAGILRNILRKLGEEIICDTNWKLDQCGLLPFLSMNSNQNSLLNFYS